MAEWPGDRREIAPVRSGLEFRWQAREILAHSQNGPTVSHLYLDLGHECLHESQAATSRFVARSRSFPHAAICDDHEKLVVAMHSSNCDFSAKLGMFDRIRSRLVSCKDDVIVYLVGHADTFEPRGELPPKRAQSREIQI